MDNLTSKERSHQMGLVRPKDTKPELFVRRIVHGMGYRFKTNRMDLPGRPDLVFPIRKKIIFIHGCFWHGHKCLLGRMPKSRIVFWKTKISGNKNRDQLTLRRLRGMRWRCLVVWECQLRDRDKIAANISRFLKNKK